MTNQEQHSAIVLTNLQVLEALGLEKLATCQSVTISILGGRLPVVTAIDPMRLCDHGEPLQRTFILDLVAGKVRPQ